MTDGEIRQAAQMYALVAEIETVKVFVEGMKAENAMRAFHGVTPAYNEAAFRITAEELAKLAKRLREEI